MDNNLTAVHILHITASVFKGVEALMELEFVMRNPLFLQAWPRREHAVLHSSKQIAVVYIGVLSLSHFNVLSVSQVVPSHGLPWVSSSTGNHSDTINGHLPPPPSTVNSKPLPCHQPPQQ